MLEQPTVCAVQPTSSSSAVQITQTPAFRAPNNVTCSLTSSFVPPDTFSSSCFQSCAIATKRLTKADCQLATYRHCQLTADCQLATYRHCQLTADCQLATYRHCQLTADCQLATYRHYQLTADCELATYRHYQLTAGCQLATYKHYKLTARSKAHLGQLQLHSSQVLITVFTTARQSSPCPPHYSHPQHYHPIHAVFHVLSLKPYVPRGPPKA